jgi:hypothetical protein
MMQIDRRGSYTATYRDFLGIPKGKPIVIRNDEEWRNGGWDYYYVSIKIERLRARVHTGFPLPVENGVNWVDKVFFEHLYETHCMGFTFLQGYGFREGFNTKIRDVAVKLWTIRTELKAEKSPLELIIKRLLNSFWGKSIAKIWEVKMRTVEDDKLVNMLKRNAGFVYEMHRVQEGNWSVALARPIVKAYRMPQFGVNVLSHSIVYMHQIICEAEAMGMRILYTNTDCLLFEVDQDEKMRKWIGPNLGQFDFEFEKYSVKFICLSKKKYLHCFEDGKFRVRFPPKNVGEKDWEAWFERRYLEKTTK